MRNVIKQVRNTQRSIEKTVAGNMGREKNGYKEATKQQLLAIVRNFKAGTIEANRTEPLTLGEQRAGLRMVERYRKKVVSGKRLTTDELEMLRDFADYNDSKGKWHKLMVKNRKLYIRVYGTSTAMLMKKILQRW